MKLFKNLSLPFHFTKTKFWWSFHIIHWLWGIFHNCDITMYTPKSQDKIECLIPTFFHFFELDGFVHALLLEIISSFILLNKVRWFFTSYKMVPSLCSLLVLSSLWLSLRSHCWPWCHHSQGKYFYSMCQLPNVPNYFKNKIYEL